jgi:hypothetical protein
VPRPRHERASKAWFLFVSVALLVTSGMTLSAPIARASGYPLLPLGDDAHFLEDLSAPTLSPGSSGTITFEVFDPLTTPLSSASVSLGLYAFNAYPGNATGPVPSDGTPLLSTPGTSATSVTLLVPSLDPGTSEPFQVTFSAPSGALQGTYAVRTSMTFSANATIYRLESRGFFSTAQWEAATTSANGSSTLDLAVLGVSGVVPETSVLVLAQGTNLSYVLYPILAIAIGLAALGGYLSVRGGPGSRSGARASRDPQSAPRAFGNKRTNEGD